MKTEHETAKTVTGLLDESASQLKPEITDGLKKARERAALKVAERSHASISEAGLGGILRLFGDFMHHHRVMMPAAMVCSAAIVAFVLTQHMHSERSLEQGDAFLLASELPPEAFLDRGFDTWVARTSRQ